MASICRCSAGAVSSPFDLRLYGSRMFSISMRATPPELDGAIEMISKSLYVPSHRRALLRLVRGQVFLRDQAAVGLHVGGDRVGNPALVEGVRTVGRNGAQRLAEVRLDEAVAGSFHSPPPGLP